MENLDKAINGMKALLEKDRGKMPAYMISECYVNLGSWDKEVCESS